MHRVALELELVGEADHVDIGLVVVVVIADSLVAVEGSDGVLLGEFPVGTHVEAGLLQAPGIEELDVGVGRDGEALLVVLNLQAAAQHVLTLAVVGLLLPLLIVVIPAVDGLLWSVGVLPALAEGELQVAELLRGGERDVEAVAHAPVMGLLVDGAIGLIGDALVVIVEEDVARRGLEPLGYLIVGTEAPTPAIDGLRIVARTELALESEAPLLGEFLLYLEREVESEVIALRICSSQRQKGKKAKG